MKNKTRPGMQYELSLLESCRNVLEDTDTGTDINIKSEFLTTFLDTVPLPVFYKDLFGKYLGCNKAFEHFTGKKKEDIIGRNVLDIWSTEFAEEYRNMDIYLFKKPGTQIYESQIRLSDGSKREVIFHKSTFSDASGKTAGIIGLINDVTEVIETIRSLEGSARNIKSILHSSTEAIILINVSGVVLYANEVAAYRLKIDQETVKEKNVYDLMPPEVAKEWRKLAEKVIAECKPCHYEGELDGYAVLTYIYPIISEDRKVEKLAVFGEVITAKRRTQRGLLKDKELYRSLIETVCDGYLYVNLDGDILEANETYCKISGYAREELLSMSISDLEANESYEQTVAHICRVIESGKDKFSTKHRTKNGKILDIEVSTTYSEELEPGFFSFFKDVTKNRKAEECEKHLKKVLLAIRKVSQLIVREKDPYNLIKSTCADLTETLGYHDACIALMNENGSISCTAASGIECERKLINEQLENGKFPFCMASALKQDGLIVIDHPDPNCGDCPLSCQNSEMSGMASRLQFDGRTYGVLAVLIPSSFAHDREEQELFIEIAEDLGFALQKINTENALLESEQNYRTLADTGQTLIWTSTEEKLCNYFNLPWLQFTGRAIEQELGNGWIKNVHSDDIKNFLQTYTNAFDRREKFLVEYRLHRHDGEYRWFLNEGSPRYDSKGKFIGYISHCMDITERKKVENEREITIRLLSVMNSSGNLPEMIASITELLQSWSGCEAVGIRLKEGDDYPYYETYGFPERFVMQENLLCARDMDGQILRDECGNPILECMCGNVINAHFDPALPFFTQHGSFWTNSTTELLASTSETDRLARTRNRCNGEGYESVALIPIRIHGNTFGLIQLNDSRKGMFTKENIAMFEHLADSIALELAHSQAQNSVKQKEKKLASIFKAAPFGIGVVIDRIIVDVNLYLCEMTGYSCNELIGCSASVLYTTLKDFNYVGKEKYRQIAESGIGTVETLWRRKDGTIINVLLSSTPIDSSDMSKGVTFTAVDITSQKKDERALADEAVRRRILIEQSRDGIVVIDMKGKVYETNQRYAEMLGYSVEEVKGLHIWDWDVQWTAGKLLEMINLVDENGQIIETRHLRKDGNFIDVEISASGSYIGGQKLLFCVCRDVTERKMAEKELLESESRNRLILENSPMAVFLVRDGKYIYANPMGIDTLGYLSPEEAIGLPVERTVSPRYVDIIKNRIENASKGLTNPPIEVTMIHPGKEDCVIEAVSVPMMLEDGPAILVMGVNITERKKAEAELKKSEQLLRKIFDILPVGLWIADKNGKLLSSNKMGIKIWGAELKIDIEEYRVFKARRIPSGQEVAPDDWALAHTINEGITVENEMLEIEAFDGKKRMILNYTAPVQDEEGNTQGAIIVNQDISSLKMAEEAVRKSEERLSLAMEASDYGFWDLDLDTDEIYLSPHIYNMLGLQAEGIKGNIFLDPKVFYPDDRITALSEITRALEKAIPLNLDCRLKHASGECVWVSIKGKPFDIDEIGIFHRFVGTMVNITPRIKAEEALLYAKTAANESNRIKSDLLTNITHELRTPLTAVIGFSDVMLEQKNNNLDDMQKRYLKHINKGGKDLLGTINKILDFSRYESSDLAHLSLGKISVKKLVYDTIGVLSVQSAKKSQNVDVKIENNVPEVLADEYKLKQIIYNLVENAIKFTDEKGSIQIEVSSRGNMIQFSVRDNGIGIKNESLDKIFDPFIQIDGSISRKYGGTGMGLALVKKFVELHGGNIRVESEPEYGSNFIFKIPVDRKVKDSDGLR